MAELRQIRTLHLRASRREQVARKTIALEDALRTASLPQLPRGAILLVRLLDLGRLPADAPPQWLSRHIETRLRALQPALVRVRHDEEPPAASLVWFADRTEALAALLAASLQGVPRAWYWAGVLPGWRHGMTMRELLPRALHEAEATAGAAGVAALLERLLRLDRLDPVLDHLDPAHVAPASGASTASIRPIVMQRQATAEARLIPQPGEASVPAIASDAWRAALTRWGRRWGAADQRSRWLAAHALIAVHGPAAAAHADRLVAHLTAPVRRARAGPTEAFGRKRTDLLAPAERDWQPSHHGGLLLVLPALARLEIAKADPEGDLCLRLLHRIADRLRIRKHDPIRRALPKPLPRQGTRAFVPPAAWRGLRLPRGIDLGREDCLLAACQLVLARYLRRYAKISLRRLVRRPALVHATPTHIDLRFDCCWVELAVRLAGLDLDPGWVPWLGRVVSFHYDYEGQP
jgi:hypothetical protein